MEERSNTPGKQIVPAQEVGSRTGAAHSHEFSSREEAVIQFTQARSRLLDVNGWNSISGIAGANFLLTDEKGIESQKLTLGNYIRIDLPGPGPAAGDGFDWVRIEDIQDGNDPNVDEDWTAFRVRPTPMPGSESEDVAHFYRDSATSTFIIKRMGNHVTAAEGGRNEIPNTGTKHPIDNLRNAAYAKGAEHGIAEMQWKTLMQNIVEGDKTKP